MSDAICSVLTCSQFAEKRGWCGMHYRRWQRWGDPLISGVRQGRTPEVRFWEKVNKDGPLIRPDLGQCWVWTGAPGARGYGIFWANGKSHTATRFVWQLHLGSPLPEETWVLHHCDNRPCVRLEHHFFGDAQANVTDMVTKGRHKEQIKTHCIHGHEFSAANTKIRSGKRCCRTCESVWERKRRNA